MNNLVDDLMLEKYVPVDIQTKVTAIKNKRMAILSFMSDDRLSFTKLHDFIKEHSVSEVTHLSQVHDLLSSYIKITKEEKKTYSVATTPLSTAFEVLDRLPQKIWHDPESTFLDPGCGTGMFPLVIINKLMDGLKRWEPDSVKRYQHIVENMLYVSDFFPKYIFMYKCLVDPFEQYKLNTYAGNTRDINYISTIKDIWGIEKFTAVVGMPPYTFRHYINFITNLLNYTQHMAYIVPTNLTISGQEANHLETIRNNGLNHVTFMDNNVYNLGMNFIYFILDRNNKRELININDVAYIAPGEPIHDYQSKLEHSIMVKIFNLWHINLDRGKNYPVNYKTKLGNVHAQPTPTKEYNKKMVARLGGGKRIEYNYVKEDKTPIGNKLIFPKSGGGTYNNKNFRNINRDLVYNTYIDSGIGISNSIMYIAVNDRLESERLSWYIAKSLWVRYVFIKYNNYQELSKTMFSKFIPTIDLSKIMTDDDIFRQFKLSDSEIQHIRNVVYDI